MVPVPVDVDGMAVRRDLRDGTWRLDAWGHAHALREWTWGERARLVDGCVGSRGFDRHRFMDGLLDLLLDPEPPEGLAALYAYVALGLLGVRAGHRVEPLVRSQVRIARAFGWGPAELDRQPASQVDRMLEALSAPQPASGGWNSIVVVDEPGEGG